MTRYLPLLLSLLLVIRPAAAALPATGAEGNALPSLAGLVERVSPAVVNIVTFGGREAEAPGNKPRSTGSGVVIDAAAGLILSNQHVVGDAERIRITLVDERQFDATLLGSDPAADLALLQIEADRLEALPLADSSRLRVGDFVIAVGNPFGLGQTVTSGIVSALGRTGLGIENYEDFIQTDASINPGNSGGALINLNGELVGINTAILAPNGGNSGIGFAIPSNMAKAISDHLAAKGDASRGSLGVSVQDLTPSLARAFGLPEHEGGVLVSQIKPASAAARAGVQVGDIIVAINDQNIRNTADLKAQLGVLALEERLKLALFRQRQVVEVSATLDQPKRIQLEGDKLNPLFAGVIFNGDGELPGIPVLSVRGDSNAAEKGLSPGDLIVSVNQQRVRDLKALASAVKDQRALLLVVNRAGGPFFIALDP